MTGSRKPADAMLLTNGGGALSLVLGADAARSIPDSPQSARLERLVTEAFEELSRPIFRYVRGFVRDTTVARDVTQEVFVRLCTELAAGRAIQDVRAWLFRVAHNLAIDEQRRLRTRQAHERAAELLLVSSDPSPSAEHDLLRRELHGWLRDALPLLSAQERRCLLLRAQGLRYREIADVLDIRIPTVVTFLTRAIQKLTKARR
ncbi:MAG: sigma-70 family RNA polymerase sigma factor [Luteitalea sp.]|nr:sigma-70 family RNA polymerase sigma factor [Luteitalea sp.]